MPGPFAVTFHQVGAKGLWPLTSHYLCLQTDTSDPEKVVSTFLKVASVYRDEASVKTAVLDAVGNVSWVGLVDPDAVLCSVCLLYIVRTWSQEWPGQIVRKPDRPVCSLCAPWETLHMWSPSQGFLDSLLIFSPCHLTLCHSH